MRPAEHSPAIGARTENLPSPQALYWTYADLAAAMGHSIAWTKANMKRFEAQGFPAPAPWWRREKRWNAEAVRNWMRREELRAGSLGKPDLRALQGGRG